MAKNDKEFNIGADIFDHDSLQEKSNSIPKERISNQEEKNITTKKEMVKKAIYITPEQEKNINIILTFADNCPDKNMTEIARSALDMYFKQYKNLLDKYNQ